MHAEGDGRLGNAFDEPSLTDTRATFARRVSAGTPGRTQAEIALHTLLRIVTKLIPSARAMEEQRRLSKYSSTLKVQQEM